MQPGSTQGSWTVVINRSKPVKRRITGCIVLFSAFLLLALVICALVGSFDDHTAVSDLDTATGIPIVSSLSNIAEPSSKDSKPVAVVQARLVSIPPESSGSSLASMGREVS